MVRLLYVIDSLAPGGAETSLAEMAPGLVDRGVELHVLALGSRLDLKEALHDAGAEVHVGPGGGGRLANVRRVLAVIDEVHPELVHTTLYEADVAGRLAAHLRRVPSSTSIVGDTYADRPKQGINPAKLWAARAIDRATARSAARFHAVSEHLALTTETQLRVPRRLIDVIPRGRDGSRFPFRPEGVREDVRGGLGIGEHAPVVLAVGRLERVKGLVHLLEALPRLADSVPDVQVLIAGKDGAAGDELREMARRSPVPVRFLGHRTDVPRLMAAADVLCFPSLSEGSPGTVIEAMATGCPVVASDIAANLEVLGRGDRAVGTVFPVGDSRALAGALASVLGGGVEVEPLLTRARDRFVAQYEICAVADRMVHFFEAAAHGRSGDPGRAAVRHDR